MLKLRSVLFLSAGFILSVTQSPLYASSIDDDDIVASESGPTVPQTESLISKADIDLAADISNRSDERKPRTKIILEYMNRYWGSINPDRAKKHSQIFSQKVDYTTKSEAVNQFLGALQLLNFVDNEGYESILSREIRDALDYKETSPVAQKVLSAHYLMLMDVLSPLNALSCQLSKDGVRNSDSDERLKNINRLIKVCGDADDFIYPAFMVLSQKPLD
jgi:hypothetical protein